MDLSKIRNKFKEAISLVISNWQNTAQLGVLADWYLEFMILNVTEVVHAKIKIIDW